MRKARKAIKKNKFISGTESSTLRKSGVIVSPHMTDPISIRQRMNRMAGAKISPWR
ncbi:MAG TPA: hypothetical protein VFR94_08330 [Nitrososphaeraceae archaeon]|nr:hypothetical protein [Nitrososphaeraceae archaeon]